ncbi:gamma-glutamyl-gamma-aminobutyrate hydrolase family protein [Klebsiella pneumoniae]|nr:gamma-glutamyl-gamma-aminobutyrate hydrolase family protein [Klebsiella pneumoniae]
MVIIGPGPGDPRNQSDPRVSTSTSLIRLALQKRHPLVAICLGHQIMCSVLGFKIERMDKTRQGMQKQIDFFGVRKQSDFIIRFLRFGTVVCRIIFARMWMLHVTVRPATSTVFVVPVFRQCNFIRNRS